MNYEIRGEIPEEAKDFDKAQTLLRFDSWQERAEKLLFDLKTLHVESSRGNTVQSAIEGLAYRAGELKGKADQLRANWNDEDAKILSIEHDEFIDEFHRIKDSIINPSENISQNQ